MIKVFNTGAQYSAEGQRIAYMEIAREVGNNHTLVAFYDGDRNVSNIVRIPQWVADQDAAVHREYLNCNYVREMIIPGPMEDALRKAAQAFGRPVAEIERVWVLSAYHLPESVYESLFKGEINGVLQLHDGYSLMVDVVGDEAGVVIRVPQPDELTAMDTLVDADLYAVLSAAFGMGVQAVKFDRDAQPAPDAFGLRWFHGD